jgi:hypothetical protein
VTLTVFPNSFYQVIPIVHERKGIKENFRERTSNSYNTYTSLQYIGSDGDVLTLEPSLLDNGSTKNGGHTILYNNVMPLDQLGNCLIIVIYTKRENLYAQKM